jgi:hypothetical protein
MVNFVKINVFFFYDEQTEIRLKKLANRKINQ